MTTTSKCMSFTADSVGGEYNHKLVAKEIPYHEHAFCYTWGDAEEQIEPRWQIPMQNNKKYGVGNWPSDSSWNDSSLTCGDESHNNIQPFITVTFWKRVS